jgi:multidrug efflux pump subunit AcrA (membrane-fusion protein)
MPAGAPLRRMESQVAGPAAYSLLYGLRNPMMLLALPLTLGIQRRQLARQQLHAWAREEIALLQRRAIATLDGIVRDLRPEIVLTVRRELASRIAEVRAVLDAAQRSANVSVEERGRRVAAIEGHLAALTAQIEELDGLLSPPGGNLLASPRI